MSSGGRSHTAPPPADRAPVTLPRLAEMKAAGEPIVMVTAYDYPSAKVAEEAGVDIVLVGDSAAMVVLGYPGTEPVSMEEMIVLGKAVRRGLRTPLMVGDMPMGSYEASNELAVQNAQRLVKETGCQTVKLEAGGISVERARAIVRAGIPVMGHVGLTPQTATALGGYKAQGKTAQGAIKLCEDALALQSVGCFAIVFEAVPAAITEAIVEKLEVPTIGIGAGPATSGQVLVFHDLLGITTGRMAKFVKRYADVHDDDGRGGRPLRRGGPLASLPRARPRLQRRAGRAGRVPALPRPGEPRLEEGLGLGAAALRIARSPAGGVRSTSSSARSAASASRSWSRDAAGRLSACGSTRTRRLLSPVSPPGRQPRGAAVRSDESRRREREAARASGWPRPKRKRRRGRPMSGRGAARELVASTRKSRRAPGARCTRPGPRRSSAPGTPTPS